MTDAIHANTAGARSDAALRGAAFAAWIALAALQVAWHGWLAPPESLSRIAVVLIALAPLAAPLLALGRPARALLIASIVALAYFCHGVMEAWAEPAVRMLATLEIVFTLALIGATGTIGLLGRRAARSAAAAQPKARGA